MMWWLKTAVTAIAVAQPFVAASYANADSENNGNVTTGGSACTLAGLRGFLSELSQQAEVYLQGSPQFDELTERWSNLDTPTVNIAVLPATENDVAEVVQAANKCNIPFLAYNGRHGWTTALGQMDWGIAIGLDKLSGVEIAHDGQTATIAGGTNSKVVTDKLWAAGKQTVTGACECVSYLGPGLGGGHGWLQGRYGLITDQFVSLNVVLADGTLHTIDDTSDLWWAMKGAGHNFGIVTSATVKIYPRIHTNWAMETLIFTGDKVKTLYQTANDHLLRNGTQPVDVINQSWWFNVPEVDPDAPVAAFYIIQEGVSVVDPIYADPFRALGPVLVTRNNGSYRDIARWFGISLGDPLCQMAGLANPLFPIYLQTYNPAAQQEAYDLFASAAGASSPFANALFLLEGYSMQGVKAVDPASTAFAFRGDNLLIAPQLQYEPAGPERDREAVRLGSRLREILRRGSGREQMHVYVNYAIGNESPEELYGYERWRQDRLRALKRKYDPNGRFSFYAPVP